MPRWTRPWTRSSSQMAARSLSSGTLARCPGGGALLEEPLLHVPEGAFHLALPLGVSGLAGPDLGVVELGEVGCRRMEGEPPALGLAECPHPVGAQDLGDPAYPLEEPDQALEGVLPVDGGGEPPDPHPGPAENGLEALDVAEAPLPRPVRDVRPVELALLARCRHDPGGGRRRRGEPGTTDPVQVPGHAHIGASEPLGPDQLEHGGGEQPRGGPHQFGDPGRPDLVDHRRVGTGPLGRGSSVLQPAADGARVIAGLLGDLLDAVALALHRHDVHELLLSHHFGGPSSGLGAVDAQDPGGADNRPGGSRPGGTQESAHRGFG